MADNNAKDDDIRWMGQALALADAAARVDEVPVGAVVVRDGQVIGEGFNQPVSSHDPSAHAEIVALRAAARSQQNYRLPGATLYVTIEPCTMCLGAIMHARIGRLVFGAREPRAGVCASQLKLADAGFYNHRLEVVEGVEAEQAGEKLRRFFAARR